MTKCIELFARPKTCAIMATDQSQGFFGRKQSLSGSGLASPVFSLPNYCASFSHDSTNGDVSSGSESDSFSIHLRAGRSKLQQKQGSKPDLDDLRKDLLERITTDIKNGSQSNSLLEKHGKHLETCHSGGRGKNPTILHWIARRMSEFLNKKDPEFRAGLDLAEMTMTVAPHLIAEVAQDNSKETPLHVALNSGIKLKSLVERMCGISSKEALKQAIRTQNDKDENCLHLAITNGLEITSRLIEIAGPEAFTAQRKNDFDGKLLKGGGNTPLHDLVDLKNWICEEPKCTKDPKCASCEDQMAQMRERRYRVLDLLQKLIERCDQALVKKNSADESPYLLFLSNSAEYQKQNAAETIQSNFQVYEKPAEVGETLTSRFEEALPRSANKAKQSSAEGRTGTGGKADIASMHSARVIDINGLKPKLQAKDQAPLRPNIGIAKTPSILMGPPPPPVATCKRDIKSRYIADDVEKFLLESAFRVGGFDQACECFFGANEGACPSS